MLTQIVRWGNSLALRIPSAIVETLGVTEGASVRLTMDKSHLLVSRVTDNPVYDVADLAAAVDDSNNYSEVDFGKRVGSEIW